ncbi:MAG: hypothetical protein A2X49_02075 [Lentisphaerae bacterium GWF2_52_8]|nr:MAG: hypothetical protein A2X49_02075 [Lentisphaerae bacterium GWF2_52_8]
MGEVHLSRNVPLRHEIDVFVAGGGPAGIAACIAAARQGASVYLAEGESCFGGMGTSGLVPFFCQFANGVDFLAGGVGEEVYHRLWKHCGVGPDETEDKKNDFLAIKAEILKRVYDELLIESGALFSLQTKVVAIEKSSATSISHVYCAGKSGLFAVKAKAFVDCSGDGDLAAWAGAAFEKGDEKGRMMAATLCSIWSDIDWDTVKEDGRWPQEVLPQAIKDGIFSIPDLHLPGFARIGVHDGGGNLGHVFGVDGTDETSITKALCSGRKQLAEYERFYKTYLKGYEKMELLASAALLGVRETRRITTSYILTAEDFKDRASFEDEIGRYSYPVDLHSAKPDLDDFKKYESMFSKMRYGKGESYGIPYRVLTPAQLDNVLVAGRCVGADRIMQSSIRVMPACFITGQAAGVAAALAAESKSSIHALPVREIQGRLKSLGAFLPK